MSWYRPFNTVLFCPPTPGSKLAKGLQKVAEDTSKRSLMRIKVVERAGITLKSQLPGLQEKEECMNNKDTCFVHKYGGKGNCRAEGVVYKGTCMTCDEKGPSSKVEKDGTVKRLIERKHGTKSIYIGESSRSAYQRGLQHMYALKNPRNHANNAFCKHILEYHRGESHKDINFKVDVVKTFKRPMDRQIWEGVEIHGAKRDILMNSKLDHYQPAVGRIVITHAPRND